MATGAAIVGGLASAYGANENRRAAEAGTTTTSEPWGAQVPHLENIFGQAQQLYLDGGPDYFPGSTVVPFSNQTQTGLNMIEQQAMGGTPLNQGVQDYATGVFAGNNPTMQAYQDFLGSTGTDTLSATAGGDFLNANPYLDQMFDTASGRVTEQFNEDVMPGINAAFSMAGRTGSPAHMNAATDASGELADSLTGMASDIYGGNYARERQNMLTAANQLNTTAMNAATGADRLQMNTAGMLPMLTDQSYDAANRMLGVGGIYEGQAGQELAADIDRFNYDQNRERNNLADYLGFIQGNYGGTSNTSMASAANPLLSGLGGGLAAYQMFSNPNPYAANNQAFGYGFSNDPFS